MFVSSKSALTNTLTTEKALSQSLKNLSSGEVENLNGSDQAIVSSIKNQKNSLIQGIRNANDLNGIVQIADNAIQKQIEILNKLKTEVLRSVNEQQNPDTKKELTYQIQNDLNAFQDISLNTSYNGMSLLTGNYTNKIFQLGSKSNEDVLLNISSLLTEKVGSTDFISNIKDYVGKYGDLNFDFFHINELNKDVSFHDVSMGYHTGEGIGVLADLINQYSGKTGVRATYDVSYSYKDGTYPIRAGTTPSDFTINGVKIEQVPVKNNDADGALVSVINSHTLETGVVAWVDVSGVLNLKSPDGRAIEIGGKTSMVYNGQTIDVLDYMHIAVEAAYTLDDSIETNFVVPDKTITSTLDNINHTYTGTFNQDGVEHMALSVPESDLDNLGKSFTFTLSSWGTTPEEQGLITGNPDYIRFYDQKGNVIYTFNAGVFDVPLNGVLGPISTPIGDLTYTNTNNATITLTDLKAPFSIGIMHQPGLLTLNTTWQTYDPPRRIIMGEFELSKATGSDIDFGGTGLEKIHFLNDIVKENLSLSDVNISTKKDAQRSISIIESSLLYLNNVLADLSKTKQKADSFLSNVIMEVVIHTQNIGNISGTDFAKESQDFTKYKLLNQSGTYVLSEIQKLNQSHLSTLLKDNG
jgi:flagellin-like hook-associated protein FlgL